MTVQVTNAQRQCRVATTTVARLARCTVQQLGIRVPGLLVITFLDARRLRRLNQQFLRQDRPTDVLSFRYDGEPIVGEVLIAPSAARRYAHTHRVSYQQELLRYVVHGILHWTGLDDKSQAQRRRMRKKEDDLLWVCRERRAADGAGRGSALSERRRTVGQGMTGPARSIRW